MAHSGACRVNRTWHAEHRLSRRASFDERVAWHIDHALACGCRPIPPVVAEAIEARRPVTPA
jgi:Uri superfamily endonuclease